MYISKNRRIEKKRERRGFGDEDRNGHGSKWENREKVRTEWVREEDKNGYGSKWENREQEGKERVWGGRQEWIWVK